MKTPVRTQLQWKSNTLIELRLAVTQTNQVSTTMMVNPDLGRAGDDSIDFVLYLPALSGMWPAWYIIRHIDGDIQM